MHGVPNSLDSGFLVLQVLSVQIGRVPLVRYASTPWTLGMDKIICEALGNHGHSILI